MKIGVIEFPGSNCDHDAYHVAGHVMGQEASFIWHKNETLGDVDAVIIPGGFSYGDALRSGAIARFSPIMKDIVRFAQRSGPVLGICNGFQILCECGLLPGALTRNSSLRFACRDVFLRTEKVDTLFTSTLAPGQILRIPIAHGEGNYTAPDDELDRLERDNRIVFRYTDEKGNVSEMGNPNGSARNIAGIVNEQGNVLGMMPHPERRAENVLGRPDGLGIFQSLVSSFSVAEQTAV